MYFKEKKQTNKQQQKDPLTLKMLSTFPRPIDLEILLAFLAFLFLYTPEQKYY